MGIIDELNTSISLKVQSYLKRKQGGDPLGVDSYAHTILRTLLDGSDADEALGVFVGRSVIDTSNYVVSLADSVDPMPGSDAVPSMDPEGLKLRALLVENLVDSEADVTFYRFVLGRGNNPAPLEMGDDIYINPGGFYFWFCPQGATSALLVDGVSDELKFTIAPGYQIPIRITYLFG